MRIIYAVLIAVVGSAGLAWAGLRVRPSPLAPASVEGEEWSTMPVPSGLPAPVARFYADLYGDEVPVITSAVISGRATVRIAGVTMPARFRFTHRAGHDYRHYIETTLFGLPAFKVNEHYLDGQARMALPTGVIKDSARVDQAANLALWAEALWFPSVWITDDRVRWEPVDEVTSVLIVPFRDMDETIVVRFDANTGRLRYLEAMRYRDANDRQKRLWIGEALSWRSSPEGSVADAALTWFDEGTPWAVFHIESVVYNADVSEYVRQDGP